MLSTGKARRLQYYMYFVMSLLALLLITSNYAFALSNIPVAGFSVSTTVGPAPLSVQFADISTGAIDNWSWDFGDGSGKAESKTSISPNHSYDKPGTYTATLTTSAPSISGAAYNNPESATYKATFSMDVLGGSTPSGSFKYYYAKTRMNLVSTAITAANITSTDYSLSGVATINGVAGYTFTASGKVGAPYTFAITVMKGGLQYSSAKESPITGGSILVGNSSSTYSQSITVQKDYNLSLNLPTTPLQRGQSATISGSVIAITGEPIAYMPVEINIVLKGSNVFQSPVKILSKNDGTFSYSYYPAVNSAGNHLVTASFTSSDGLKKKVSGIFEIRGLQLQRPATNPQMYMNSQKTVEFVLRNIGESDIDGLTYRLTDSNTADAITAASNLDALPTVIHPGETVTVPVTITTPLAVAPSSPSTFSLDVSSSVTGSVEKGSVSVYFAPAVAEPEINLGNPINFGIKNASTSTKTIRVNNKGYAPIANATLSLRDPVQFNWIRVINGATPEGIGVSQGKDFQIYMEPTANILGRQTVLFDFTYVNQMKTVAVPIAVTIDVTPETTGKYSFKVYNDLGLPLSGASVTLISKEFYSQNNISYNPFAQAVTDSSGVALLENMTPSNYRYIISMANHEPVEGEVLVEAGVASPEKLVILPAELVKYTFDVVHAPVKDTYLVKQGVVVQVYKVMPMPVNHTPQDPLPSPPKPLIICSPSALNLSLFPEDPQSGIITCRNYGSVDLLDATIDATTLDPDYDELKIAFGGSADTADQAAFHIDRIQANGAVNIHYSARIDAVAPRLASRYVGDIKLSGRYSFYIDGVPHEGASKSQVSVFYNRPTDISIPSIQYIIDENVNPFEIRPANPDPMVTVRSGRDLKFTADGALNAFSLVTPGIDATDTIAKNTNTVIWQGTFAKDPAVMNWKGDTLSFSTSDLDLSHVPNLDLTGALTKQLTENNTLFYQYPHYIGFTGQWDGLAGKNSYLIPVNVVRIPQHIPPDPVPVPNPCELIFCGIPNYVTPFPPPVPTPEGIVKFEIDQTVTLERQGFRGIFNMIPSVAQLEDVHVALNIKDADGHDKSDQFIVFVENDRPGIAGANLTGVAVNGPAEATWRIIPKSSAGGTTGNDYFISATLDYRYGQIVRKETAKDVKINVRPMPILTLEYEVPGELQPGIPVKLKVKAINTGFGPSNNLQIASAQPKIVENLSNIPVNFNLLGSSATASSAGYLDGVTTINFGNIPPNGVAEGYWLLNSCNGGKVLGFDATLTHQPFMGVQLDPLIESKVPTTISGFEPVVLHISGDTYNSPESPSYRATFSMDVSGGNLSEGWLKYYYSKTRKNLQSTSITGVTVCGSVYTIKGMATVNGTAGYTFSANVVKGSPDGFAITIIKPDGAVDFSAVQAPANSNFQITLR
ncbi:MAG: PKD domain-containing protein [Desulfuromonadales bacterium]|nr:MAG: PKD domain-containing protein [Desulfuromonadales bacterium]